MPVIDRCLYYVLDQEGLPVPEPDLSKWASFFESSLRVLKQDTLPNGATVITVFLGIDSGFGSGPPILWGTMIFGGPLDKYEERYVSREDALTGHEEAIIRASGKPQ
jgi:hypothetical protein